MNTRIFLITIALLIFITDTIADAQWRSKTHDVYNALTGIEVKLDGELDEWEGVLDAVTGTDGNRFVALNTLVMYFKNTMVASGKGRMTTKPVS